MEPCFADRLRQVCIEKFAKYNAPPLERVEVRWVEGGGLRCTIGGESKGIVKAANLQLRNLVLQRCESDRLVVPPPTPGVSSLPVDALQRSVGGAAGSWRFNDFISKLERNETVRIVAVGASNTAMFAETCSGGGGRKTCTIDANTDAAALASRLAERARKLGKVPGADWLARLVRIVHAHHPGARLIVRTIGYGGCV